jgi:hypothetical protein
MLGPIIKNQSFIKIIKNMSKIYNIILINSNPNKLIDILKK